MRVWIFTRSRFWSHFSCCLSAKRSNWFKSLKITAYLPVRSLTRKLFRCACLRQCFGNSTHLWSFFRSNHVVEWKEKHRRQLIHLVDKNAVLDCTIVKFYMKELNDCLTSIEDVLFGFAWQFRSSLSCDNFCPVSRTVASRADMQIEKQTDPAKTGLVRCLVSQSHGSEVCNCCVQRVFFLSRQDHEIAACRSFATKKKPSGTQGNRREKTWATLN